VTGYNAGLGRDVLERERWHYLSCDCHSERTASTKAETLTSLFNMLRGWGVSQMFQNSSVAMRPQRKRGREDEI
jgi:hypothetical protein